MTLGRLEKVDLRTTWQREDTDFTPWLAEEDNLAILAETIGTELELEAVEKNVGPFRADILCREAFSEDRWVLIENQLARTDHSHLGQLLTYAAGLDAATIVWIAAPFADEHRKALDWLNEITDTNFRFFGLEIELWRIGDSPPAPRFNVIASPNDWSRRTSKAARSTGTQSNSALSDLYYEYWNAFLSRPEAIAARFLNVDPPEKHEIRIQIKGPVHIKITAVRRDGAISVRLPFHTDIAERLFDRITEAQAAIESDMDVQADWNRANNRDRPEVVSRLLGIDIADRTDWPRQHAWLFQRAQSYVRAFYDRIREIDFDSLMTEQGSE